MLTRDGYRFHARKMRKDCCEDCGCTKTLCAHHINGDWTDNSPSNIKTLCSSCHTSLHHKQGDLIEKRQKPPCIVCGKPSYRSSQRLCSTHRTRLRRYGNPCLVRKQIGPLWQLVLDVSGLNTQTLQELRRAFPEGWTDLKPSETPSSRKSQKSSEEQF